MSGGARDRRGVALATALFALIAIALLVRAVVVPSVASRRAATRSSRFHGLEAAAEAKVAQVAGRATRETLGAMRVGEAVRERTVDSTGAELVAELRRASVNVWAVRVDGTIGLDAPAAVSRTLLLELRPDSAVGAPAITAGGGAALAPGTIVAVDTACGGTTAILEPPDPRATDPATYAKAAGARIAEARLDPDVRLPAGQVVRPEPDEVAGTCIAGAENWGSTAVGRPCHARRPVVVAEGDLEVAGGEGQGILLVSGSLRITGPFRFDGIIVAADGILSTGADVHIAGALFTSPSGALGVMGERTRIIGSGCAVADALAAAARPAVVRGHGWFR